MNGLKAYLRQVRRVSDAYPDDLRNEITRNSLSESDFARDGRAQPHSFRYVAILGRASASRLSRVE